MSEQDPKSESNTKLSASSAETSEVNSSNADTHTRRVIFSGAFLGLLVQACSNSKFKGTPNANTSGPQTPIVEGNVDTVPSTVATSQDLLCTPIDNPKLDPTKIPDAEKASQAVFYGRPDSALLALLLPAGEDIKQLIIMSELGKLMALHGITGADKKADGSWRPIVIDSLPLLDNAQPLANIIVLLQYANRSVKTKIPVVFATKFQDKPVVDLSGRTVPPDMIGRQSIAQFQETPGSFALDAKAIYPNTYNSATVRNLQTAKSASSWTPGVGVMGIITDIMGNVIDISGANILEHQVFCTYVATPTGFARTMIHLG